jgi:DNA polymerase-3 subunit epsilon
MPSLAFLDTETTGLDAEVHELLEVAVVLRPDSPAKPETEIHFSLAIDPSRAEEKALEVNRFYERGEELAAIRRDDVEYAASDLAVALTGATVVGNNVGFDLRFLKAWLSACGVASEPWSYMPLDLKAWVAGRCGMGRPASTRLIAEVSGVPIPDDAHTALVDARWNRDVYNALTRRSA